MAKQKFTNRLRLGSPERKRLGVAPDGTPTLDGKRLDDGRVIEIVDDAGNVVATFEPVPADVQKRVNEAFESHPS